MTSTRNQCVNGTGFPLVFHAGPLGWRYEIKVNG